jgi:hypothetical protein
LNRPAVERWILGGTAARLFKLPPRNEKQRQNLETFPNLVA